MPNYLREVHNSNEGDEHRVRAQQEVVGRTASFIERNHETSAQIPKDVKGREARIVSNACVAYDLWKQNQVL